MKQLFNINIRSLQSLWMLVLALVVSFMVFSCSQDELDIQDNFPFEVKVMPVRDEITNGETIEIRMTIERTGDFSDTEYFIRYFQYDGQGVLQYYDEPPYLPNDLYPLASEQFRLYYTSTSDETQSFDIWISDNFGNEKKLSFQFSNGD